LLSRAPAPGTAAGQSALGSFVPLSAPFFGKPVPLEEFVASLKSRANQQRRRA